MFSEFDFDMRSYNKALLLSVFGDRFVVVIMSSYFEFSLWRIMFYNLYLAYKTTFPNKVLCIATTASEAEHTVEIGK